jgi:hypothetical protein
MAIVVYAGRRSITAEVRVASARIGEVRHPELAFGLVLLAFALALTML